MATYVVGDLQGCDREFCRLLERLRFCDADHLWLVGDLVNRGPDSLATLRRIKAMGDQCTIVLGNHDLHFLAIYYNGHIPNRSDTLAALLAAPDVDELAKWLRCQKLMHLDPERQLVMTHAGLPHIWTVQAARQFAREVERVLAGRDSEISYAAFFAGMYGNEPSSWSPQLAGMPRLRVITSYFTRMRLVDAAGAMDFQHKGALHDVPPGWHPWYDYWPVDATRPRMLFGHWAALNGETGREDVLALDTGCVWGRTLTALNVDTGVRTSLPAGQM